MSERGGFRSLIGTLQTDGRVVAEQPVAEVSIPHRYSTNGIRYPGTGQYVAGFDPS